MDRLTIPRYMALLKYWRKNPPVHLLVAAYMGYKSKDSSPVTSTENENAALELMRALGG